MKRPKPGFLPANMIPHSRLLAPPEMRRRVAGDLLEDPAEVGAVGEAGLGGDRLRPVVGVGQAGGGWSADGAPS
jgi:hypothetical protein